MDPHLLLLLTRTRNSHILAVERTRATVEQFITRKWNALESFRGSEMTAFVNAVIPTVLSAEKQVASLTNSYLARMNAINGGKATRLAPLNMSLVTGSAIRNGVDPSVVYARPEKTVNAALAKGKNVTAAVTAGLNRAVTLAMTDLQLAKTHTIAAQTSGQPFRRVLTGNENCFLCLIDSAKTYEAGALMPTHPGGDDCTVQELHTMNPDELDRPNLTDAAASTLIHSDGSPARAVDGHGRGIDLVDGSTLASSYAHLVEVREHGEYGPTLTWRDNSFTSAADLGL